MRGSTVLVTGGTGGIGRATATGLAGLGARVAIVGRDRGRAEAAAASIRDEVPGAEVDALVADLSAQAEVRRLADEVLGDVPPARRAGQQRRRLLGAPARHRGRPRAHVRGQPPRAVPAHPGCCSTGWSTARPARVVTVSSGAQSMGRIDFEDLQGERSYRGQRAYNQSKLANVLFTYELAATARGQRGDRQRAAPRRGAHHRSAPRTAATLDGPACVPVVQPVHEVPRRRAPPRRSTWRRRPTSQAVSGRYFVNRRPKRSSQRSYDEQVARRLWDVSAELTGLGPPPTSRPPPDARRPVDSMKQHARCVAAELTGRRVPGAASASGPWTRTSSGSR